MNHQEGNRNQQPTETELHSGTVAFESSPGYFIKPDTDDDRVYKVVHFPKTHPDTCPEGLQVGDSVEFTLSEDGIFASTFQRIETTPDT
jgi:hypothetical protein